MNKAITLFSRTLLSRNLFSRTLVTGTALSLTVLMLASCDKNADEPSATVVPSTSITAVSETVPADSKRLVDSTGVRDQFKFVAQKITQATLDSCIQLKQDTKSFLVEPNHINRAIAQETYHLCHLNWAKASLFFQVPFEFSEAKELSRTVDLIDTRPFLPGYIDGIPEYPFSGLVHELDLAITKESLYSQHRLMDEESASVGFPIIEFFLWKEPLEKAWSEANGPEQQNIINRRIQYLDLTVSLLTEQLSAASLRWSQVGEFSRLPEFAQLAFVLKSFQRLVMVDLLGDLFEEPTIIEPEWHHAAIYSGQGKQYPMAMLATIRDMLGNQENSTALSSWLAKLEDTPFSVEELRTNTLAAIAAIDKLPENYPLDSTADDNWQLARQNIAQLVLHFSELSKYFQVTIITE